MRLLNKRKWGEEFWGWYDGFVKWIAIFLVIVFLLVGIGIFTTTVVEDMYVEKFIFYILIGILFTVIIIAFICLLVMFIRTDIELRRSNKLRKEEQLVSPAERKLNIYNSLGELLDRMPDTPMKKDLYKYLDTKRHDIRKKIKESVSC